MESFTQAVGAAVAGALGTALLAHLMLWRCFPPPAAAAATVGEQIGEHADRAAPVRCVSRAWHETMQQLSRLHGTVLIHPPFALTVGALYGLINAFGGFGGITILYLSNLGFSASAAARVEATLKLAVAGYLVFTQWVVVLLGPSGSLALLAALSALSYALIGYGTDEHLEGLVATSFALGHTLPLCMALVRAAVVRVLPADLLGTAFFGLAIVDQLSTLMGDFGIASLFASTAGPAPSAVAWLCAASSLAVVLVGQRLDRVTSIAAEAVASPSARGADNKPSTLGPGSRAEEVLL